MRNRDFKAENRRAHIARVYRELLDESRTKILLRDLDQFTWRETYRAEGEQADREAVVKNLRFLADSLEESGRDFTKAAILLSDLVEKFGS